MTLGIKDLSKSAASLGLGKLKVTKESGAVCWGVPSRRPCPPSLTYCQRLLSFSSLTSKAQPSNPLKDPLFNLLVSIISSFKAKVPWPSLRVGVQIHWENEILVGQNERSAAQYSYRLQGTRSPSLGEPDMTTLNVVEQFPRCRSFPWSSPDSAANCHRLVMPQGAMLFEKRNCAVVKVLIRTFCWSRLGLKRPSSSLKGHDRRFLSGALYMPSTDRFGWANPQAAALQVHKATELVHHSASSIKTAWNELSMAGWVVWPAE